MDPGPPHRLTTPFNDRLGTNYTPSFEEVTLINSFLREPLDILNAQVLQTQSVLQGLLAMQSHLKDDIEGYRILCHPVRQLPDELLVEIFSHTLPINHLPVMDPSEPPIVLTHICQRWRSLALSTPTLWSSVHIPVPAKWSEKDDKHVAITGARAVCLEWWLGNSARQPLTISLYWPRKGDPPHSDASEYRYIIPFVLYDHFSHISDLTLDVPERVLEAFFSKISADELTSLEKISLHNGGFIGNYFAPGNERPRVWRSPMLKKICWGRSCVASIFGMPGLIQWDKLQEVSIMNGIDTIAAFRMTTAAPNLVKLSIVVIRPKGPPEGLGELGGRTRSAIIRHLGRKFVVLPCLTTLYVAERLYPNQSQGFAQTVLEYLQLPLLRHLTYQLSGEDPTEVGEHPLLRFLRSQTQDHLPLTRLKISSAISRSTLIDCLAEMPKLEHLWLGNGVEMWLRTFEALAASTSVIWDDRLLLALSPAASPENEVNGDRSEMLCPHLRSFRVDKARFTFQQIREFVQGRLPPGVRDEVIGQSALDLEEEISPLQHLSIGLDYVAPPGIYSETLEEEFRELGVKATMTFEKAMEPMDGHRSKDGLKIESFQGERGLWAC